MKLTTMHCTRKFLMLVALLSVNGLAQALEFKSIAVPKAILYDAPSLTGKKMLLLSQYYPVEVIVNLKDWLKVRDALGGVYWVEAQHLQSSRTVLVKTDAKMLDNSTADAQVIATIDKDVVLQVIESKVVNGFIKVKHRDGATGFVAITVLWGVS